MRFHEVLAPQVSHRTRSRGEAYFIRGAVRSLEGDVGSVQATVRGSDTYKVRIEHDGQLLEASCTCRYLVDHLEICKHVWAVILAAEAAGVPLIPPSQAPTQISLEPRRSLLASPRPVAETPDDVRVEIVDEVPKVCLRLHTMRERPDRLRAELTFEYEHTEMPPTGSPRAIKRNADAEADAVQTLQQYGCRLGWSRDVNSRVLQLPSHLLSTVVPRLLDAGWSVKAEGKAYHRASAPTLHVRSGIDWFELHGNVSYGEQSASLPSLLAAFQRGDSFVTLGDGSVGLLPEEWLRRYAPLAHIGSSTDDHLRFRKPQAALLDAMIGTQPGASWDETFAHARAEIHAFDGIHPAEPPATFVGSLRGYQREGLGWLRFLQRFGFGGCLADDMGLGKTVMVLALLAGRRHELPDSDRRPSLVVAPRSVVFNWRQEAARFAPDLRVLEYVGPNRAAARATFDQHDVVLTTYGTVRRDVEALSTIAFDYVVLDESQAIKTATTASAKATRQLIARHRLALSGTPIENHIGEVWSLFEFLNPGLLGSSSAVRSIASGGLDDEAVGVLARGLRPFILRRTKEQVASDLPQRTEQTLHCELEPPQRALYDELRAHYRRSLLHEMGAGDLGRRKIQVLEALLRLRQAACHPGLIDRGRVSDPSAKLDVLIPRLQDLLDEGHKTLVFSQFTSLLAIVRTRLDEYGILYEYLDGRTCDREARVERFQRDPQCRLFLISLKAGGLGLNLTAADYVFLLDPWWNPAVEAQAIDRAHRIGQAQHVFAYRLIARDTVEERVLELQQRKRRLADAVLAGTDGLLRDLRLEDLDLLLS